MQILQIPNENTNPTFTVHDYTCDGDMLETGIYLHFKGVRIRIGEGSDDLKELANSIIEIAEEVDLNYNL